MNLGSAGERFSARTRAAGVVYQKQFLKMPHPIAISGAQANLASVAHQSCDFALCVRYASAARAGNESVSLVVSQTVGDQCRVVVPLV